MMQLWLVSLLYLVYTGIIFMTPEYGIKIPTLLAIRDYLFSNKIYMKMLILIGYLLTILNLLFPISPGPIFLGDLLPALFIFLSAFNYTLLLVKKEQSIIFDEKLSKRHLYFALFLFGVAFLHFILPHWVIF